MNDVQTGCKVTSMKQLNGDGSQPAKACASKQASLPSGRIQTALCIVLAAVMAFCPQAHAQQCSDGIDNDGDGRIDALVELSPENGQRLTVGGIGDPPAVRAAVDSAIVAKKLPYARPTRDAIVRSDRASWLNSGGVDTGVQDIETLSRVCRILGYRDYVSSTCRDGERSARYPTGKCNYHSPSNNIHWRFRNNTFVAESANPKYRKTSLATITCVHKLPACSDGWDNDGDGLVDGADGGCASANDDSEVAHDPNCLTPAGTSELEITQCSDGKDNDGDGLTDLNDPGCPNKQGNNEAAATTQCQDGIDNDGDGAKDYPADFSCSSPTDNDETNPKSQCQDGIDNDGDGLTDLNDPGCPNKQGNNEAAATTQCQDGIDNDGDGAKDYPADFSCSSPTDNDETNPKSQCQDGIDNDGDGLVDRIDPGCPSNQSNNEASGTSLCQNGIDDDKDGFVDYPQDTGCSCATDNDEYNAPAACNDGRDNDGDGLIDYPSDPGCGNAVDSDESNSAEPRVTPIAECVDVNTDGSFTARFGYVNDANATAVIPYGERNFFSTGASNRGQPEVFLAGPASNVLTITIPAGQQATWILGNSRATATANSKPCQSTITGCIETDNKPSLALLDGLARSQKANILRIAQRVSKVARSTSARQGVESWKNQADTLYLEQWRDIWSSFPQVSTACATCSSTDISGEITPLITRAQRMSRVARQAAQILRQARRGRLSAEERELTSATGRIYDRFVQATQALPKVSSVCR
jgi:hypothetical protein